MALLTLAALQAPSMAGQRSIFGLRRPCTAAHAMRRYLHVRTAVDVCCNSPSGPSPASILRYKTHGTRLPSHAPAVEPAGEQGAATGLVAPSLEVFPTIEPSKMVNGNRGFVEEHRMRGYEAGPDQHTTLHTIANVMQEVASNHAVAMWGRSDEGFASDPALADEGLIFVMTRLQIQMDEYPKWGDVVKVETWFMSSGKIGAQRDFLISCKGTGRQLGRATSSWVMINLRTRRLSKVPEDFRNRCLGFVDDARQALPLAAAKQKLPDLQLPAEIVGPVQVARRSDIDMNGHVNNVTYLAWGLETVPLDVYNSRHLYQVEIDFKAEAHSGDRIESLAQQSALPEGMAADEGAGPQPVAFVHTLRRAGDGNGKPPAELVRMRTVWHTREGR